LKTEYKEGKSPHARYVYLLKNTYQPLVVMISIICEKQVMNIGTIDDSQHGRDDKRIISGKLKE